MSKNYQQLTTEILRNIGGKNNVKDMFHCVTRLRFYLKDPKLVDLEKIKNIPEVLGAQYGTDQLQIIIGNDVADVYKEMHSLIGNIDTSEASKVKHGFSLKNIFETLAAIFLPVIPVLAGTGMIKGLLIVLQTYTAIDTTSGVMQVLTIASDTVFYFFPMFIAWSAANRFKANIPMSLALAGCLLYPIMTNGFINQLEPMDFLGLPVPFVRYSATSIPILLAVWLLSYIHPRIDKLFPKSLKLVFTPMTVMLIMTPLTLIAIAPLANYISQGLAALVKFLFDFSPLVAGAIVGSTRALVVLSGMHLSLGPIIVENINTYGYDVILPINTMGTLAMVGASLGVWYKSKNQETKTVSFSAFISAFIGITEPTIYGVLLKFKNALIATMIGGGLAGAFVAFFKGTSSAYVNSSILSLPVFVGPGLKYVLIGMVISASTAFIAVQILGLSEEQKTNGSPVLDTSVGDNSIYSPLSGDLVDLQSIDDEVFSKNIMGKGIAILPNDNKVVAPFDGTITIVYPTKHAIGLLSDNGTELIIHMGIDTVNLRGKFFDIKVAEGQRVAKGELLAEVNFAEIKKQGYSTLTPIVVLNTKDYLDVIPNKLKGSIKNSNKLIELIK